GDITGSTRKITLGVGGGTIDTNGHNSSFGAIDPGNFHKKGAGTMTISNVAAAALRASPDFNPAALTPAINARNLTISGGILAVAPRTAAAGTAADPRADHNHP